VKPLSLPEIERRVEQKYTRLAGIRREQYARREDYLYARRAREREVERWERVLLAAVAARACADRE